MENFGKNARRPVKGFDELYSEVWSKLRGDEKLIDLGEKLRIASSDLSRVQLLVSDHPFVVRKFRSGIQESYEEKSIVKSKEFFLHSVKTSTSSSEDGIDELNNAIRFHYHCPSSYGMTRLGLSSELTLTEGLSEETLQWFLAIPPAPETTEEEAAVEEWTKSGGGENLAADENNDEGSDLLSKIYLERALRWQEMGEHEACILDIFSAVRLGVSKTLGMVYKLGVSYKALGQTHYPSAQAVFHHYLQLLRLSSLKNEIKSGLTLKVVKELKEIKSGESLKTIVMTTTSPSPANHLPDIMEFYQGPSPVLIGASSAVQLSHSAELGRHAVAKNRIPPGTTLIVDHPYAWSLSPPMYSKFCQHCCRANRTRCWLPCQTCAAVVFCSKDCREKSESYHKFECRILNLLNSSETLGEMGLLSFRTIAKTPLSILLPFTNHQMDSQDSLPGGDRVLGLDSNGQLDPLNYSSVYAQTTNDTFRPAADILKRTLAAIYLVLCLRFTGYFSTSSKTPFLDGGAEDLLLSDIILGDEDNISDLETRVASLLLRHLQSASCNAYEINSACVGGERSRLEIIPIGGATYPTVSITNHSCFPNVYRFNVGKLSVVKAIMDIPPGGQILDSYGESFTTQSKSERQGHLSTQYFFHCRCPPCTEDWPLYRELSEGNQSPTIYPCPNCGNMGRKESKKCSKCNGKLDLRKILQSLQISEANFISKKQGLLRGDVISSDMQEAFGNHISLLQKLQSSPRPDKLIVECQEILKLLWNLSTCPQGKYH